MCLYNIEKSKFCVIEKTPEIGLLSSIGVREGVKLSVVTKQPLGGPIVVQIGKRNIAIAKDIAEQIKIQEVM
ncbi:FeoA family protein [Gottschalkia purinilytica]|uniref:FeoA family protein n=1 Tax=Gottschalkia purinilytica TaxID=1503 RepID=A0A0L0W8E9_GOTPU|nr:FeoA family protein [Gottschalkia purinilytica]KNF07848.1 FeoA family protein [Gottschalkia purinilytica]